jgi:hypothetical protein
MFNLAAVALAGRAESGCSGKGEKAENRALEDGLSPRGALTAIILVYHTVYACPLPSRELNGGRCKILNGRELQVMC